MGHTLAEKILMRNTGAENVQPGDIVITRPDKVAFLDIYSPFVYKQFKEMGFKKLADPDRVLIIEDHEIPTSLREDPWSLTFSHKFAEEFGVKNHLVGKGIGHQLMAEMRFAKPGSVIYVTDSHTTTYGAVGSFATGIGYTEMAAVLGTGKMWVRVPAAIKIQIDGALPKGVYSKDIILQVLGDLTASGGTYKSLEFCGTTVDSLSVDARLTMSNMAVECGGKVGLFAPDAKTCEYSAVEQESVAWLQFDDDARYERGLHYDAATLVPNLSCPQYVDNVHPVSEKEGLEVNQIFLGSCTNGRIEDLAVAAQILEGHHVPARVKFIVTPASVAIYRQAVKLGYIQTLVRAGAIVTQPFCSLCQGRGSGLLSDGEVVLGSHNRNFLGRMGSAKSLIFLGSPATVAASALRGKITDPREVLE
ncbi:aconitase/3-isopropylmalate dehydratase large subunit family protein [uncultured Pyramidobacter sp.]|uniref:3-isopropylmalate dehydratase large subunit n=1 Tax=uncultured Pyramidobacter sp. TaxID=1623495 RepID=UPI002587D609|nr:aconitase/3-isopropylmalate dehydratase large subunit family protein [uncultured Pyramidobacter sp.]